MPWKGASYRLRRGRVSQPGRAYLVTTVTCARQPLFADFDYARCVVRALRDSSDRADTLCYVLMPDHLHWLIRLRPGAGLSPAVQKAKSLASRYIHGVATESFDVWQRGFHDHAIREDEDIRSFARYVVANPLRAGIADSLHQYSFWDAVWLDAGDTDSRLLEV